MEKNSKEGKTKDLKYTLIVVVIILLVAIIVGTIAINSLYNNKKIVSNNQIDSMVEDKTENCNNEIENEDTDIKDVDSSEFNDIPPTFRPTPVNPAKPIIYLYPTEETKVSVKLGNIEKVSCIYPEYNDGWNVIAKPNGDLRDLNTGRNLYALYWEGKNINVEHNEEEGFVVKGEDTTKFLEEKLEMLGLTQREAEEFIIYWLPKMQNNKYNFIRFETKEEIEEYMPLEITPKPDTLIRVMMEFKELDEKIEVKEQKLETPKREGFVAVEWGGTEIK